MVRYDMKKRDPFYAKEEAERLGLEFGATALQANGLSGFLANVMEATQGDAESLGRLFGSVEALSEIMALGTTQADAYEDILVKIGTAAGAVDEAFEIRTSSKAEQLSGSLNKVRNSGIELAENLYPAVDMASDLLGKAAELVGDMDAGTQQTLVGLLGVTAAAGPAVKAMSGLITAGRTLASVMSGPWGWATLGIAGAGALAYTLLTAESNAEKLEKTVESMQLKPDASAVTNLTSQIQAGIDSVDDEVLVNVTAKVQSDFSAVQGEYDSVSAALQSAMDEAMQDFRVSWKEYEAITGVLNGTFLAEARTAKESSDTGTSALGREMIALIDDANTLLREIYTSGDSVTAEELKNVQVMLDRIYELRAEINGIEGAAVTVHGELTRELDAALEDHQLAVEEYEAIRKRLNGELIPDAKAAMEETSTAAVASELDAALADLDQLLAVINDRGGDATQEEIDQINEYLTQIEALNRRIDELRGTNAAINTVLADDPDYQVTVSGYGTEASMAAAAGKVAALHNWQREDIASRKQTLEAVYTQSVYEAESEEEKQALRVEYQTAVDNLAKEQEAADANAREHYR